MYNRYTADLQLPKDQSNFEISILLEKKKRVHGRNSHHTLILSDRFSFTSM